MFSTLLSAFVLVCIYIYMCVCVCVCMQFWGKLLLKVMHYNIALLPKKVTNYDT